MASCPGTARVLGPRASRPLPPPYPPPLAGEGREGGGFREQRAGRPRSHMRLGGNHSTPIVVKSWNQCCAWTKLFILGDRACGLVSCTTHTSTASSTTALCACAISSSCL